MISKSPLLAAILALTFIAMILGCSSGSGELPEGGGNPEELNLHYCRVVNEFGEMHLQWAADRPTTGEFRYGLTSYTQVIRYTIPADTHDAVILGLDFNVRYNYLLTVTDAQDHTLSCTGEFDTPEKATPWPAINALEISNITERSALISWRTDELANTILYFGIGQAMDSTLDTAMTQEHEVQLNGLTPSSIYAIRPEAVDVDGLRGFGPDSIFATAEILTLWFPPTTIALGDTAEISVHIEDAEDLAALQYTIDFADGQLEIIDITEGQFYSENSGFAFFRAIRNSRGELSNHITWNIEFDGNNPQGTDADGDGIVAIFRVRGIEPGVVLAEFSDDSTFGLDMFSVQRACSLRAGSVTISP